METSDEEENHCGSVTSSPVFIWNLLHHVLAAEVVGVGADLDADVVLSSVGTHLVSTL